jgi:serine/threonine protein kinase
MISQRLGRYHLFEEQIRLDVSGIYRAYSVMGSDLTQPVSVQVLHESYRGHEDYERLIEEEVRTVVELRHHGILNVIDYERAHGSPYVVYEPVLGPTLETVLNELHRQGRIADQLFVLSVVAQLLDTLDTVHGAPFDRARSPGIVHRDVHPRNIIVGLDGETKLSGFAYAQTPSRTSPPIPGLLTPRYHYASPEVAREGHVDHRADLFSVGLVLYELLSGRPVYMASSPREARRLAEEAQILPIGSTVPNLDPDIRTIVDRALEPDVTKRFRSAEHFLDSIVKALRSREPQFTHRQAATWLAASLPDICAQERQRDHTARTILKPESPPVSHSEFGISELEDTTEANPKGSHFESVPVPSPDYSNPEPMFRPEPVPSLTLANPVLASKPSLGPAPVSLPRLITGDLVQSRMGSQLKPFSTGRQAGSGKLVVFLAIALIALGILFAIPSTRRYARYAVVGRKPGAILVVESIPAGAKLIVDGEDEGSKTPVTVQNIESEVTHELRLELEGQEARTTTIALKAGEKRSISILFPHAVVKLNVTSVPDGSDVILNGKKVAFTPAELLMRVGEEQKLTVTRIGYLPYEKTFTPESGKDVPEHAVLEKSQELKDQEALENREFSKESEKPVKKKKAKKKKKKSGKKKRPKTP